LGGETRCWKEKRVVWEENALFGRRNALFGEKRVVGRRNALLCPCLGVTLDDMRTLPRALALLCLLCLLSPAPLHSYIHRLSHCGATDCPHSVVHTYRHISTPSVNSHAYSSRLPVSMQSSISIDEQSTSISNGNVDPNTHIYCNVELNLASLEAVGFDMDFTLAQVSSICQSLWISFYKTFL
jgi:hypothetical protein